MLCWRLNRASTQYLVLWFVVSSAYLHGLNKKEAMNESDATLKLNHLINFGMSG